MASTLGFEPGPHWWEQLMGAPRPDLIMHIAPHPPPPTPPPFSTAYSSRIATLMGAKCLPHCVTLAPPDLVKQIAPHFPSALLSRMATLMVGECSHQSASLLLSPPPPPHTHTHTHTHTPFPTALSSRMDFLFLITIRFKTNWKNVLTRRTTGVMDMVVASPSKWCHNFLWTSQHLLQSHTCLTKGSRATTGT